VQVMFVKYLEKKLGYGKLIIEKLCMLNKKKTFIQIVYKPLYAITDYVLIQLM